jgi:hypothetical protein
MFSSVNHFNRLESEKAKEAYRLILLLIDDNYEIEICKNEDE